VYEKYLNYSGLEFIPCGILLSHFIASHFDILFTLAAYETESVFRCDETADIYSFGTIVLEMASCSFLDVSTFIQTYLLEKECNNTSALSILD